MAVALILVTALAACGHTAHVRVTDANSGVPIGGTEIDCLLQKNYVCRRPTIKKWRVRCDQKTGGATIHGLAWWVRLTFTHEGYTPFVAIYDPQERWLDAFEQPPDYPKRQFLRPRNGYFEIQLKPK